MRRLILVGLVAAALAGSGSAAAATAIVPPLRCANNGGQITVPAGSEVAIRDGWAATTRHLDLQFVDAQKTWLFVDGRRSNISHQWANPVFDPTFDVWISWLVYPTGVTLGAGDSLTFRYVLTLRESVFDGWSTYPAGTLADISCTVTGA
jgi:hypothetical protein